MAYAFKMYVALFMVTFMKWPIFLAFVLIAFMPKRIREIELF